MIQVREQYGNVYVRILDTQETFEYTLEKIRLINGRSFNQATGEWMFGKESIGDLLRYFDNQIIWNQPLREIVAGCEVEDELVKKHLSWENEDDFKSWKLKPYPYQRVAAYFMADRKQAAVLDSVGLGKTVSILGTSTILHNRGKVNKTLIVTLNSIKRQWAKEIEKFTGEKAIAVTGTSAKRKSLIKGFASRSDVRYLVVNYESLRSSEYMKLIKKIPFDMVALDEAQKIKTGVADTFLGLKPSQTAEACYQLKHIPYRFIATATPVQGKPQEIWSLFHFMNEDILGTWDAFRERYCKYHPRYGITGGLNLGELFYRIAPYFIRRTKEMPEIQQQLPKVSHNHVFLEMTDAQERIQSYILDKMEELKEQSRKIGFGSKVINGQLMSPEQAQEYYDGMIQGYQTFLIASSDSPELLMMSESNLAKSIIKESGLSEKELTKSPKIEQLKEFYQEMIRDEPNAKVVIFTKFERMAQLIHRHLPQSVIYHGQLSDREKNMSVDRFKEDDSVKSIIATDALSTGANLQRGSHLINIDLPYDPTQLTQRNGRIDRSGSEHKNITMHYYIMSESYDEHLLSILDRKADLADQILTGGVETSSRGQNVNKLALERMMRKKAKQQQPVAVG